MASLLNRLRVNPIVLRMRADKAHVRNAIWIVDPDYQPVLVACDVEHDSAIAQDARITKFAFDNRNGA